MKKLLKLSLALIFVLGSYGVFAQGGTPDNAASHSVGSFHGFQVALHTGNHYEWNVFEVDASGTFDAVGTAATDKYKFYTYDPTKTDITEKYTGLGVDTYEGEDFHKVGIQWLDVNTTGKVYAVEVAEYNGASGACSTKRRYFISVSAGQIDFVLEALNATSFAAIDLTGVDPADVPTIKAEAMSKCNSFSGGILANPPATTDLGTSTFFYKISMNTDAQPWNGQWGFDYTWTKANDAGLEVKVVESTSSSTTIGSVTGTSISVNAGHPVAYLKVTIDNVLGTPADADVTMNLGVTTDTPFIRTVADVDGSKQFEPTANNGNNSEATNYVIKASPATSVFTVE